jgi:hypothetical protein
MLAFYVECHSAECRYAERRGATISACPCVHLQHNKLPWSCQDKIINNL